MGIIRYLLAITVVIAHMPFGEELSFLPSKVAVRSFFIISGYYTAMIIKKYPTAKSFLVSRFLRLYPAYLLFFLIGFITLPNGGFHFIKKICDLPFLAFMLTLIANFTMFFNDVILFLAGVTTPRIDNLIILPPIWSVSLELHFFTLAPLLLRFRTVTLFVLMALSIVLCATLRSAFSFQGPLWDNRFFPFEISYFLLGCISYRLFGLLKMGYYVKSGHIFLFAIIVVILNFRAIPLEDDLKQLVFSLLLAVSMPAIFFVTRDLKIDNHIGMLSYPIYLSHIIVIQLVGAFSKSQSVNLFVVILLTSGLSCFVVEFIDKPANRFRAKLANVSVGAK